MRNIPLTLGKLCKLRDDKQSHLFIVKSDEMLAFEPIELDPFVDIQMFFWRTNGMKFKEDRYSIPDPPIEPRLPKWGVFIRKVKVRHHGETKIRTAGLVLTSEGRYIVPLHLITCYSSKLR